MPRRHDFGRQSLGVGYGAHGQVEHAFAAVVVDAEARPVTSDDDVTNEHSLRQVGVWVLDVGWGVLIGLARRRGWMMIHRFGDLTAVPLLPA